MEVSADGIEAQNLKGFFEGWHAKPSQEAHLDLLRRSAHVVVAWHGDDVVGFCTAITDGLMCAYVPLLEVLPEHRTSGLGSQIFSRMLELLARLYMVDLCCDPDMVTFYQRFGMAPVSGMVLRNRDAVPR
ncbi:MAG: GNAT family N-acetyltransferase [Armatimonadetes bacterium]|nr:GNAT family N-acetyltransferase [Armatimonadota bacterium]